MVNISQLVENFVKEFQEKLTNAPEISVDQGSETIPPLTTPVRLPPSSLSSMIDHTILRADATPLEIEQACQEALQFGFATVCVNSSYIKRVSSLLRGSSTLPNCVVGFPLGACSTRSKAFEASHAVTEGAREIDMVIHLGALKNKDYSLVYEDIREVVAASQPYPVKVILETALLNAEQKIIACALSKAANAAFVKTSTGLGPGGCTVEDVRLMRRVVGTTLGVKASGGIKTYESALQMIAAGANRIGASSSVSLVRDCMLKSQKKAENQEPSDLY